MNRLGTLKLAASLALVGLFGFTPGCSTTVEPDNSGTSCDTDDTVSCSDGRGFSCLGNDQPEDTDSSLLCSDGTAGNAGSTLYCCLTISHNTTCADDSTVSCSHGGFGFSCADASEDPSAAYPSLNCSAPVPGNAGSATYCCTD